MKTGVRLFALAVAALLLAGCSVYVRPGTGSATINANTRVRFGIEVNDIIQVFEPTRGSGSTYYVGENIAFRVRTSRDGYITMTALDPDGAVYTFARNLYVRGGETTIIDGPDASSVFSLEPPRGLQRVRASFTPARTSGLVVYRSASGEGQWTQSIVTEVRDYDVRDILETRFFLQ